MSFSTHPIHLIITLFIFIISNIVTFASLEQKLLPVNNKDKKVTFTFYHFDSSRTVTLTDIAENLGNTVKKQNSNAAVSSSEQTSISYESGKFNFPANTTYLIQNAAILSPSESRRNSKHTFILTDDKGRHAICYAPSTTEAELGYAIKQYITTSNIKFKSAVVIHSGNQCGFYKTNVRYNPYYLKELKKPAKALLVK